MLENEVSNLAGKDPIVGIFGDQNFPDKSTGKSLSERRELLLKMKRILSVIKPERVYISPTKGIIRTLMPAMNMLRIPYIIVNPYQGFFDITEKKEKVNLAIGLKHSRSVITMGTPPETKIAKEKLLKESEDFIIDRANLIISIYGKNPSRDIKEINKRLPEVEANVIFLDYSLT